VLSSSVFLGGRGVPGTIIIPTTGTVVRVAIKYYCTCTGTRVSSSSPLPGTKVLYSRLPGTGSYYVLEKLSIISNLLVVESTPQKTL